MWKCADCNKENRDDRSDCWNCSMFKGEIRRQSSSLSKLNTGFKVFPHEPRRKPGTPITRLEKLDTPSKIQRNNIKGLDKTLGGILWVVIFITIGLFSFSGLGIILSFILAVLGASIAVAVISYRNKIRIISKLEQQESYEAYKDYEANQRAYQTKQKAYEGNQKAYEDELYRLTNEAESLTLSLEKTFQSSIELSNALHKHFSQASIRLQEAKKEYEESAFSPFWDAVESAAEHLAICNKKANKLSRHADDYYRKLDGRKHTFPVFPAQLNTIPNPSDEIEELRRLFRLGQTNYYFSDTLEQRKTRTVMIAGFRTIGDAVNNLGSRIEDSISDLRRSISSDTAKVVDEQIKTRESVDSVRDSADKTRELIERSRDSADKTGASIDNRLLEQNRMLDNIQHDRKPKSGDTPSNH
jgi:hypothetical protein